MDWDGGSTGGAPGNGTLALSKVILNGNEATGGLGAGLIAVGGQAFTVTNTGTGALHIAGVSLTGADAGSFEIGSDGCDGQTIAAGSTPSPCGSRPARPGPRTQACGSRATRRRAPTAPPTGIQSAASATPSSQAFAGQRAGTVSTAQTFTVSNTGTAPLNVSAVSLAGADVGQFEVTGETCTGTAVAPSGACGITVRFAPTSTEAKTAEVKFVSDAATSPDVIPVTGTGTGSAIAASPSAKDFGDHGPGTTSSAQTITLTNTGTDTLNVSAVERDRARAGAQPAGRAADLAVGERAREAPTTPAARRRTRTRPTRAPRRSGS